MIPARAVAREVNPRATRYYFAAYKIVRKSFLPRRSENSTNAIRPSSRQASPKVGKNMGVEALGDTENIYVGKTRYCCTRRRARSRTQDGVRRWRVMPQTRAPEDKMRVFTPAESAAAGVLTLPTISPHFLKHRAPKVRKLPLPTIPPHFKKHMKMHRVPKDLFYRFQLHRFFMTHNAIDHLLRRSTEIRLRPSLFG
ncbi:unnamed protein product, partial [Ectocarpus sp. 8 AP-2014]